MNWDRTAADYLSVLDEILRTHRPALEALAAELAGRLRAGGKILICGNGGSAADAQHMAGELVNRFFKNRRPYAAVALTTDTSVMTSIGNDFSFDEVFVKQVQALGRPGDALIGFSTSGNARNVLQAFAAARAQDLYTVALTGGAGGALRPLADCAICIAGTTCTPRIQEGHHLMMHALCEMIEEQLG